MARHELLPATDRPLKLSSPVVGVVVGALALVKPAAGAHLVDALDLGVLGQQSSRAGIAEQDGAFDTMRS